MLILIYLAAIVIANLSALHFGPWIAPLNAFIFIGLDLTLRDRLHENWTGRGLWRRLAALIAAGSALSFLINRGAGQIAAASAIAFLAASAVDSVVFQAAIRLGGRRGPAVFGSNIFSALIDSIVFPLIAFGGAAWPVIVPLYLAKVAGASIWYFVLTRIGLWRD